MDGNFVLKRRKNKMNIYEKLLNIQNELKCNKNQYNKFGGYKYRSCEDILEAVKPICKKYGAVLVLSDTLVNIGERYYIQATARLTNIETNKESEDSCISNTAYAREEESKKGMDGSQITGTASSYARKYALNGLFNIDDTKDADTDEFTKQTQQEEQKITKTQAEALEMSIKNNMLDINGTDKDILAKYGYKEIKDIKMKDYMSIVDEFRKIKGD
jgi:hypothetical protein